MARNVPAELVAAEAPALHEEVAGGTGGIPVAVVDDRVIAGVRPRARVWALRHRRPAGDGGLKYRPPARADVILEGGVRARRAAALVAGLLTLVLEDN
jgi:hypothetical protein